MEGEDGSLIVLNSEGKPLQSPHGKNITFEEYEKEVAEKYFEYPKAEERSNAGNKEEKGTGNGDFRPPKNDDEYIARVRDPKITPKERIQLTEFWTSKNKI